MLFGIAILHFKARFLSVTRSFTNRFPDEPAFIVPKCLKEKVEAGDLGRKSGRGFYVWDGERRGDPV